MGQLWSEQNINDQVVQSLDCWTMGYTCDSSASDENGSGLWQVHIVPAPNY